VDDSGNKVSAMRRRDYHKKKAIKLKSDLHWHNYKRLRSKVNKLIRETKSTFYINKISECADTKDLKKCWSTINSLLGKQNKSNCISELKVGEHVITDPNLIAEHFNTHFINIGVYLDEKDTLNEYGENLDFSDTNIHSQTNNKFNFSLIKVGSASVI
jgi:hypothetical protein